MQPDYSPQSNPPPQKLFVDYTNWRGQREWREIEPCGEANNPEWKIHFTGDPDGNIKDLIWTWVLHVKMVDRDGMRRSLDMRCIHGFKIDGRDPTGGEGE